MGGPAVHKARSLYALIADEVYLDDEVCADLGIQMRQQEQETESNPKGITVYPNPTHGVITVTVAKGAVSPAQVVVYNQYGIQVGLYAIENEASSFLLPLGQLEQGIYWLKMSDYQGIIIERFKVVLIK